MHKKTYNFIDLTGQKFFHWTFIKPLGNGMWLTTCDCGKTKENHSSNIKKGKSRSCGCHKGELIVKSRGTHGMARTRQYFIWRNMLNRCYHKSTDSYHLYGGRGITVCDEWKHSFDNFWSDMGGGYKEGLSIDRIDINGNYEPGNCRWATNEMQANNKRNNKYFTYNGKQKTLTKWADTTGIKMSTLQTRLRKGMSFREAVEKPLCTYNWKYKQRISL